MRFGSRRYALKFDDGHVEYVNADGPTQAVALRRGGKRAIRPHTITDMTALKAWMSERVHTTPMLDRIYGTGQDDDGWDSRRPVQEVRS